MGTGKRPVRRRWTSGCYGDGSIRRGLHGPWIARQDNGKRRPRVRNPLSREAPTRGRSSTSASPPLLCQSERWSDTRSGPARIAEAVRQAIAARADGLTAWGLDCEQIGPQPLRELDEAGVMVSAGESQDCDPPLFDAVVSYSEGAYEDWFRAFGEAQATALIAATEGKARVILFDAVDIPSLGPA